MPTATTPQRLILGLIVYFAMLIGGVVTVGKLNPDAISVLPMGGVDALDFAGINAEPQFLSRKSEQQDSAAFAGGAPTPSTKQIGRAATFLAVSLGGTILVMLPITWAYTATRREIGYRKNFVRALIVLPICATTIILLIQNNLALAFGLAAMVAAVRFRVSLQEAIDGIYIFAAICVGLAAGIGYLGVAVIMAMFFSLTNAVMWGMNYGQNELDDARSAKNRAKLEASSE